MTNTSLLSITLLIIALIGTVGCGINRDPMKATYLASQITEHGLPLNIYQKDIDNFFNDFKFFYNSNDYSAAYNLLSRNTRQQVSKENVINELKNLKNLTSNIISGKYSHSELAGSSGSASIYFLFYDVILPKESVFKGNGLMKTTVILSDSGFDVLGVHIRMANSKL